MWGKGSGQSEGCLGQPFVLEREGRQRPQDGLNAVEASLRTRFGEDWFEAMWRTRTAGLSKLLMVLWGCWGVLLGGWTWWEAMTPMTAWWLGLRGIPEQLLGRKAGAPCWAMERVELNADERRWIGEFLGGKSGVSKAWADGKRMPATGKDVWLIREQLELRRELRDSVSKMGSGVSR